MKNSILSILLAGVFLTSCESVKQSKTIDISQYTELATSNAPEDYSSYETLEDITETLADKFIPVTVGIMVKGINGMGSGVIVSEDGIIMTAAHVIGKANSEVTVFMPDGRRLKAKGLGVDYKSDAALVKIINEENEKFLFVEMGKSSELKAGQFCLAMGHSGGILKGRQAPLRLGRILINGKGDTMQTNIISDATVISGDSGGPLFDLTGKVIGINSSIGNNYSLNRHVPVDVYHDQWDDFMAGKTIGKKPDYAAMAGKKPSGKKSSANNFRQLLQQRIKDKDPEALKLMTEAKKNGGKLNLKKEELQKLMKKWGANASQNAKQTKPAAKNFKQLLQQRIKDKDPEALKLMAEARKNGGKLNLKKEELQKLMEKWSSEPSQNAAKSKTNKKELQMPANKIKPELMEQLKKFGKMGSDGKFKVEMTPENADELKPLLKKLGLKNKNFPKTVKLGADKNGKAAKAVLEKFKDKTAAYTQSTVKIMKDGKHVALGTIVSEDGYIITKASEVYLGEITCKIGKEIYDASFIRSNNLHDVALIKVDAENLTPVIWSNTDIQRGSWIITPDYKGEPVGLGIISHETRKILRRSPTVLHNTNKVFFGVFLDHQNNIPDILKVVDDGAAKAAGVLAGDRILEIDGEKVKTSTAVVEALGKFNVDDTVEFKLLRDNEELIVESKLKPRKGNSINNLRKEKLEEISLKGGTVSKRNSAFPAAITHDCILQSAQCGGPLLNLKGEAIGLNIARANRAASYALPASIVQEVIQELLD